MARNKESSATVDAVLKALALGTITGVMLAAPNAVQSLEKPLEKFFYKLDEREKIRKLSKLRSYLKTQGLVRGDYDHGVELTNKALKRIKKYDHNSLAVKVPPKWDGKWRIVMFDIPETKRDARVGFTRKMQEMGFQILQQSVWIHPFESKPEVYSASSFYGVDKWVTYIVTDHIDNEKTLVRRFKLLLRLSN